MDWSKRAEELELIDLGGSVYYSEEEYRDCLDKLGQVGRYLGGDRATLKAFNKLSFYPETILDVGCGGGGFTQILGKRYERSFVHGLDNSLPAIHHAASKNHLKNVVFKQGQLEDVVSKSYDIVTCTLVLHHLKDRDLISFLHECFRIAKKAVIINDLHRHPLAWRAFRLLAPLLFRNRLISHDGSLSIKRAFRRADWKHYFEQIEERGTLLWYFPFRWVALWTVK